MKRLLIAIGIVWLGTLAAVAQDYPSKPIRLVVGFLPGAGADLSARLMAEALSARLGQPVVVENRPGATGAIATDLVSKAAPDGYTLLWAEGSAITILPNVKPSLPFKSENFTYLGHLVETGLSYVVNAKLPVKTVPELFAYAKENPGKVRYGTAGVGSAIHLATLLLEQTGGVKMVHVPYQGVAQSLTDLLAGHIDFALVTPATIGPYRESDKVRIIGVSAPNRHPSLPNVPTAKELGYPKATVVAWYGLMGPPALQPAVSERLLRELSVIVKDPALKEKIEKINLQLAPALGPDFEKAARDESAQWKAIVESEKIVVQD